MIPPNSIKLFLQAAMAQPLPEKTTEEVEEFVDKSSELQPSTLEKILSAFEKLDGIWSDYTKTYFPDIYNKYLIIKAEVIGKAGDDQSAATAEKTEGLGKELLAPSIVPPTASDDGFIRCCLPHEESISTLAPLLNSIYTPVIDDLKTLNFTCWKIPHNVDCAFSCIAIWLLEILSPFDQDKIKELIVKELRDASQKASPQFAAIIERGLSAMDFFEHRRTLTQDQCNDIILLLRVAAVQHVAKKATEEKLFLENESIQEYINRMMNVSGTSKAYGEEREISALMELCKTPYRIINFTPRGEPLSTAQNYLKSFAVDGDREFLALAFEEFQRIKQSNFSRSVYAIQKCSDEEAKEKTKALVATIDDTLREQRANRLEKLHAELDHRGKNTLVLADGGYGQYHLLCKREVALFTPPPAPTQREEVPIAELPPSPEISQEQDAQAQLDALFRRKEELERLGGSQSELDAVDDEIQVRLLSAEGS